MKKEKAKKMTAKELPIGTVLKAGTAKEFKTGDWRTERPVWNSQKCIQCMSCWINCPDSAFIVKDGKITGINYDHCKGCGICAKECPAKVGAVTMEKEKK